MTKWWWYLDKGGSSGTGKSSQNPHISQRQPKGFDIRLNEMRKNKRIKETKTLPICRLNNWKRQNCQFAEWHKFTRQTGKQPSVQFWTSSRYPGLELQSSGRGLTQYIQGHMDSLSNINLKKKVSCRKKIYLMLSLQMSTIVLRLDEISQCQYREPKEKVTHTKIPSFRRLKKEFRAAWATQ